MKSDEQALAPRKLDRELAGEPMEVGAWTVTPLARLHGHYGEGWDPQGSQAGGVRVRLDPVAVTVASPTDGSTQRIEIDDPTSTALRGMARVGLVVAGVSLAIRFFMWMRRRE